MEIKDKIIQVRLTPQENQLLASNANMLNITQPDYVRRLINIDVNVLDQEEFTEAGGVKIVLMEEDFICQLFNEIGKQFTNINQIKRSINIILKDTPEENATKTLSKIDAINNQFLQQIIEIEKLISSLKSIGFISSLDKKTIQKGIKTTKKEKEKFSCNAKKLQIKMTTYLVDMIKLTPYLIDNDIDFYGDKITFLNPVAQTFLPIQYQNVGKKINAVAKTLNKLVKNSIKNIALDKMQFEKINETLSNVLDYIPSVEDNINIFIEALTKLVEQPILIERFINKGSKQAKEPIKIKKNKPIQKPEEEQDSAPQKSLSFKEKLDKSIHPEPKKSTPYIAPTASEEEPKEEFEDQNNKTQIEKDLDYVANLLDSVKKR